MGKRRRIVLLGIILGIPCVLAVLLLLYVNFADLSGWRDTVGSVASDAIGRELKINGEFTPRVGFSTRVEATDITLANPEWSRDPHMMSVDRLAGEIDLLSIFFPPLTFRDVEISGARVLFEVDAGGRFNWVFGTEEPKEPRQNDGSDFEMVIENAQLAGVELVYTPADGKPIQTTLDQLEFTDDGTGMLDLELVGTLMESELEISGRLGTFVGLINAKTVEHDLKGCLAGAEFSLRGAIDDLSSLRGVDAAFSAGGSDLQRIATAFGLDRVVEGPFTITASAKPVSSGSKIDLEVTAVGLDARMTGTVDSLTRPKTFDATVKASGPDIRTLGALTGAADLPDEEFSVSGGLRWEGFPVTLKKVEITVGDNSLFADGVLGAPPTILGTDFSLRGEGPDVSAISALFGIDLPHDSFSVTGHVVRVDGGLEIDNVQAKIGRTNVSASGRVGDPPEYFDTSLSVHAEGPNIALFDHLVGVELPAEPFTIDGRLGTGEQALTLDAVTTRIGEISLRVDGTLKTEKGLSGSTLQLAGQGPDATIFRDLIGLDDLPAEAWSAAGGLTILDSGLRLDGASAAVGSLEAHGDGRISTTKGLVGSDLQLRGRDPDLSHGVSIFGVNGFPPVAATVEGRLRVEAEGIRLDGATGTAGDIDVAVDGLIGTATGLEGTQAHLSVHGPRLSSLGPFFGQTGLPAAPFSLAGALQIEGGAYHLSDVVAKVDHTRATVNGTIAPVKGLVGTDVRIEASAPDLGSTGRLLGDLATLPDLPPQQFTLATRLHIVESGYEIDGLRATLDRAKAKIDGRIGALPGFVGTDLTVESDGPDASLFRALTGVTIPVEPYRISGTIKRTEDLIHFDRVAVRLAGHSVDLHGSLGERPHLIGTELDLQAAGPGTGLIADLTGFDKLPDEPFALAGSFRGTPEKFTAEKLNITFGGSDINGSLDVDIRNKPTATARLSSQLLDIKLLLPGFWGRSATKPATETPSAAAKTGLVLSDKPIDFGWLQRADADVDIAINTLQMPIEQFKDVTLQAKLIDGRLDIHRVAMVGSDGGSGSASMVLEALGEDHRLQVDLKLDNIRFEVEGFDTDNRATQPPIDIDIRLQARGSSLHGFAGSSDGSIEIVVGRGEMDNSILDLISADFLLTLLEAFNPFSKEEAASELECAVILLRFDKGLVALDPMALQSDKMTMLGGGKIDLGSEKLDLDWVTKPRKGIGISASMLTNPYIKLGGSLANPTIELKPLQAAASTGAAVATMGISLLAKGILDRLTAENKVCKKALKKIAKDQPGN